MFFENDDDNDDDPKYYRTVSSLEQVDSDWEDKPSVKRKSTTTSVKSLVGVLDTRHKNDKTLVYYFLKFLDFMDIVNIDRGLNTTYSKELETMSLRDEIFTNRSLLYVKGCILQKLQNIQLESHNFSDEGYIALAQSCPNVKRFQLHGCEFMENSKCFEVLGPAWPNLNNVWLRNCGGADDNLVMSLFSNCHGIYRFDYWSKDTSSFITDAVLDFIGEIKTATTSLEYLTLSSPLITAKAIQRLNQKCINLHSVDVVLKSHDLMYELKHLSDEQVIHDEEVTKINN